MSEKYIDLAPQIASMYHQHLGKMRGALGLLDEFASEHPDQVPGRTITRSEYRDTLNGAVKVSGYGDDWERGFNTGLVVSGTKVVPDPEPTNAERLETALRRALPAGTSYSWESVSRRLDEQGVRAPGGDDDQ